MNNADMVNFYEETIFILECHGKTPDDILWIGKYVHDGCAKFEHKGKTTDEFMRELFNFNYDNGYGGEVICTELMIVGKTDWWMDRREYDGSEWWEYHTKPSYPDTKIVSPVLKDILSDSVCRKFNDHRELVYIEPKVDEEGNLNVP